MGRPVTTTRGGPPVGFTLLETVTATAASSILLLALGSAMLLTSRALPAADSPAVQAVAAAGILEQVAAELQYALSFEQRSNGMVEFTVPDRNNDGLPEVIRYEWSGTAGAALTRRYNGGTASEVLSNVRDFTLSYDIQGISQEVPNSHESAETLLIGYGSVSYYKDYPIKDAELYSEYFRPVLPADATSWKVTRVRFYAKGVGYLGGETAVQLQTPTTGGLPSGVVLEEERFYEYLLSLWYLEQEVNYTHVSNLSPQQGLCLVFRWRSDADACSLLGQDSHVTAPNLMLLKSTDRTTTWVVQPGASLLFSVYGTVTTAGTPQIHHTYYVNAVTVRLQASTDDQAAMQTSVRILNRPEVTQ